MYTGLPYNISMLYNDHNSILLDAQYDQNWANLVESRYLWNK